MAENTDNNTAVNTGFSWGGLLDKGIEILPELIGLAVGKQTTPTATVNPTSLNPASTGGTGAAAGAGAAGANTTLILAIGGGVVVLLFGAFMLAGRKR
ncbi:MAG: hypothetical protein LBC18_10800 [Opitutaceae bacterium]|jgi:hypothetical protein|nr:hypothetical protein [Opitutaceae bacterium]